ncbi:MAG: HD domain-containing phosphohydrolase [Desulfitobacteriaceae bacterium]
MKIRLKTFIIIISSAFCIALFMSIAVRMFLIKYEINEEDILLNRNYQSLIAMLNKEKASSVSTAKDWSIWNDTYEFIKDSNQEYINDNLKNDSTFINLKLNMMIFTNNEGKIIYSKGYDLDNHREVSIEADIINQISKNSVLLSHSGVDDIVSGMLIVSGKPMIIVSSPITTSDEKSTVNGSLIIGRYINDSFMQYLEEVTRQKIMITDSNNAMKKAINQKQVEIQNLNVNDLTIKKDSNFITGSTLINDVNGYPNISITMSMQRDIYKQGLKNINFFSLVFLIGLMLIVILCIIVLDKTVIERLKLLDDFVRKVGKNKDVRSRIYLPGKDEITSLALSTNQMLHEIEIAYQDIRKVEERFRLTMEATNDGFWDLNIERINLYISSEWLSYVGDEILSKKELYEKYFCTVNEEEAFDLSKVMDCCIRGDREHLYEEYWVLKKTGERLWVLNRGKVVEHDESGKPIRMVGTFSDISKKKQIEQEIFSLSYTDKLTGLKNRAFMEKILDEMHQYEECRYTILMGDLNGLKYTNDAFGHHEGDKLLCRMADILRECCSDDDINARWGGDEFLILIKNKDKNYSQELIRKIKCKCDEIIEFPVKLNIALGSADKDISHKNKDDVIKKAEERMYRNKLLEKASARNSTLISLERTLFEKNRETEEHAVRLRNMCIKIGEAMGFLQDELDELALLAMLHDIGKIAIPDHILIKPDKLTDKEWEVMKTHTEIGYRIAISTPELAHIAEDIRCHHERYDGKGYPQGLKGEDIPRMSRILAIVDSYDVITHERPYKAAINTSEAVEELIVCTGKQFDPELVELFLMLLKKEH